ncbi:MAG: hypothetical protein ABIJ08_05470 [Nanoarchaeota archaeon]
MKKRINVSSFLLWIMGILFILIGFVSISDNILGSLMVILSGVVALPPFGKIVEGIFNKKFHVLIKFLIIFTLFIFGFALISPPSEQTTGPIKEEPISNKQVSIPESQNIIDARKVDIYELISEYDSNEVRADEKYKGEYLEFGGTILGIKKGILDKIYIQMGTNSIVPEINAEMRSSEKNKVINLDIGDEVTLICKSRGKLVFLYFEDCILVK